MTLMGLGTLQSSGATLAERIDLHRRWLAGAPGGIRADFSGETLADLKIEEPICGMLFCGDAALIESNLAGADGVEADLTNADLRHANLQGADLTGADLSAANLQTAWLNGANLSEARILHTRFRQGESAGMCEPSKRDCMGQVSRRPI